MTQPLEPIDKKSLFYCYTVEEGYHATRAYAYLALACLFLVGCALAQGIRWATLSSAWTYYNGGTSTGDVIFAAGLCAGFCAAFAMIFFGLFIHQSKAAGKHRRAYKLANPTQFNSAGELVEAPTA